jgi:hypothetical protein
VTVLVVLKTAIVGLAVPANPVLPAFVACKSVRTKGRAMLQYLSWPALPAPLLLNNTTTGKLVELVAGFCNHQNLKLREIRKPWERSRRSQTTMS